MRKGERSKHKDFLDRKSVRVFQFQHRILSSRYNVIFVLKFIPAPHPPTHTHHPGGNGTVTVTAIAAGGYHTCAVASGMLWCWGNNSHGQLGIGSTVGSSSPQSVSIGE